MFKTSTVVQKSFKQCDPIRLALPVSPLQVRLNLETIRADVEEFGGKAYRMGKANKDDAVVAFLKDQLDDFKQVCGMGHALPPCSGLILAFACTYT